MTAPLQPVIDRLVNLHAALDAAGPANHEAQVPLRRVEEVLTVLERNLDGAEPIWLTSTSLARLAEILDDLLTELEKPSALNVDTLGTTTDHLIDFLGSWQIVWVDAVAGIARSRIDIDRQIADLSTYLETSRGKARQSAEQALVDMSVAHRSAAEKFSMASEQQLAQLNIYVAEAQKLVGFIAGSGLAGGFQTYAQRQERSANRWRLFSVLAAVFAAALAIGAVFYHPSESMTLDRVVSKTLAILLIGTVAAYAGRESRSHREREVEARRLSLELSMIDPYLADLPAERRAAVKEQIAQRYFGRTLGVTTSDREQSSSLTPDQQSRVLGMAETVQTLLNR